MTATTRQAAPIPRAATTTQASTRADVPAAEDTMRMYQMLMDRGMQNLDNIAVYLVNEMENGAENLAYKK